MAAAVCTANAVRKHSAGNWFEIIGTITVTASPDTYTAGGNTLTWGAGIPVKRNPPLFISIEGDNGYTYQYVNGADALTGKLKILTTANTEVTAGAVPAQVSGDTITFMAVFSGQA